MPKIQMIIHSLKKQLQESGDSESISAMAKFGITPEQTHGVKIPQLRGIAKEY